MTTSPAPLPLSLPARNLALGNIFAMGSMLAWAAGLPAANLLIPLLPAEQLGAVRVSIAALFLLPIWLIAEGPREMLQASWLRGIMIGSLLGISSWMIIIGQGLGGAVTAAVITATMPIFAIALEVLLDGRRLSRRLVLGIALSMAGGVLTLDFSAGGSDVLLGVGFCCLSILCYVLGSRFTVTALPDLSLIGRTALTLSGAAIASIVIALISLALGTPLADPGLWGLSELIALLVFAIAGLSLAQIFWIRAVRRIGIGMTSLHSNAAPFYVMIILWLFFAAPWNWAQAAAAALVALGVLIAQGVVPLPRAWR
ncbi:DMT family transporter [Pseudogemmobacter faecipullorum]|uniref:DMT family transporter n=1 Tax=Pseudogemmobacter faecipullorum TaxID=2755041 RepID=A0ABS8CIP7_9RHOB|nr:DMT family transporter [Pseudogemmobacter faecipullorum]MCB5409259.1 DMT family transporter [Pseudogemmobacter faecipullorum]